jgi:SAM-dependent methyltransferase
VNAPEPVVRPNPLSLRDDEHELCPACRGRRFAPVVTIQNVPTNSCLMLDSRAEAVSYPRGDIALVFCETCGFIFNRAFDPKLTEYSERYEPTQAYSPTFLKFHKTLAKRLVETLGLKGKTIVEVGCGQGEFLHLLCREGGNSGLGFDPAVDERREDVVRERADNVRLVADFFSDQSIGALKADFLCSKMTLEHIPAVDRFVSIIEQVARQSAPGMRLFLQIPESERILTEPAFWDIYYEHCNYFTEGVLRSLFARHGFVVEEVTREYDGQYLALVGRFTSTPYKYDGAAALSRTRSLVLAFSAAFAKEVDKWRKVVAERVARGKRVVIWGSGSKGVSFLSALGDGGDIAGVVDINPHRQGKFMVGSGHLIVGPADLRTLKPETVIIMNCVYEQEIRETLASLNLAPEIFAL